MFDQAEEWMTALKIAKAMRAEQTKFFKAAQRSPERQAAYTAARRLERDLDRMLDRLVPEEVPPSR